MEDAFTQLSIVIAITTIVSLIMRRLKQPLILGYILSGLLVGPSLLNVIHDTETFEAYSKLGIALLLFIIGLGMNVKEVRSLGKVVVTTSLATLLTIGSIGAFAASGLGFSKTESLVIGLSLFFSSTIIIVKILSDKKEQNRLHGQIAIGVILVEDFVATLALLFVVANKSGGFEANDLFMLLVKGVVLISLLVICSTKILPKITRYMASSQEMLFLFAIAWGFGVASLFEVVGFSVEVGALFSGVALASSPYAQEISSRLKPLRDFFVVIFFITLGGSLNVSHISGAILPAIILSMIVIIGKPLVVTTSMGLLGYPKRVSFLAGINLSQISEFSIILVVLASGVGLVGEQVSAVMTLVAIATIATSTYMMYYSDTIYGKLFEKIIIKRFDRNITHKEKRKHNSIPLVLFGYSHGGHEFIKAFKEMDKRFIVVDYNPSVIESLEQRNIPYIYGDATDLQLLEEINVNEAKFVVTVITDHATNVFLLQHLHQHNPKCIVICHADSVAEAIELYGLGASFVILPHYIGNEKVSGFIRHNGLKKSEFNKYRTKHLNYLQNHFEVNDTY